MQAFLVLLLDKMQGDRLKGKDGMELMITSFSGAIPIEPKHITFWKNVLNLSFRKLRYNVVTRIYVHARMCIHACVHVQYAVFMCEYVSHTY